METDADVQDGRACLVRVIDSADGEAIAAVAPAMEQHEATVWIADLSWAVVSEPFVAIAVVWNLAVPLRQMEAVAFHLEAVERVRFQVGEVDSSSCLDSAVDRC